MKFGPFRDPPHAIPLEGGPLPPVLQQARGSLRLIPIDGSVWEGPHASGNKANFKNKSQSELVKARERQINRLLAV